MLSETFAVAVRRAEEIPHGHELPWLYVVAEHVLRNQVRSQQRAQRFQEDLRLLSPSSSPAPELPLIGPELDELPDRERTLLVMTALEGLSAAEAADRMGIPYGSARNALMSGRRRLADRLAAAGIAVAAALLLAVILLSPSRRHEPRAVARTLDRTIAAAATVHEVAYVRTSDEPRSERYERWSALDAGSTTVELPSGRALSTTGTETLRAAARRDRLRLDAQERAHLDALQVAAPASIQAMLATPAARASLARGPRIAGHPTTTFTAERADAAGRTFRVRVTVASDDASVLEVRSRRLSARGAASDRETTVRFVAWEPERRPAPTRHDPAPATPAAVAVAPGQDATGPGPEDRVRATPPPAAAADRDDAAIVAPAADAPTPVPAAPQPPILHTRVVVRDGPTEEARRDAVTAANCTESWLEVGGAQRFRVARGWEDGRLGERWFTGSRTTWWSWSIDGSGVRRGHSSRTDMRPAARDGGWIRALLPTLETHAQDPDLPATTTLDGAPALLLTASLPTGQRAQILLHPATRAPLEFVIDPGAAQQVVLTIKAWTMLPGSRERALIGHPPAT